MPQGVKAHSEKQQWVTYPSLADAKPASCLTGNTFTALSTKRRIT